MDEEFDSFIVGPSSDAARKRKSLLPINQSSELDLDIDDDASSNATMVSKKRRSMLLSKIADRTQNRSRHVQREKETFLNEDQIKDQYEYAMKLHMGNKINDKNVFSLNLNLASCIFQRYQKNKNINFQTAAMDIEAGYKIWSYRVDAVHKDATQAVKDLIESNAALGGEMDEEDDGGDDGGDTEGAKGKARRRRKLQEVVFPDGAKISDKKLIEVKNPYLAVRAAKLDSATDISELKLSTASVDIATQGIQPNEDAPLIQKTEQKDQEEAADWAAELIDDLAELTEEFGKIKDIAPSFSGEMIENQLTTPVPVQFSQPAAKDREEPAPTFTFEPDQDDEMPDVNFDEPESEDLPPVPPSFADNMSEVRSVLGDDVADQIFNNAPSAQNDVEPVSQTPGHSYAGSYVPSEASSRARLESRDLDVSFSKMDIYDGASRFLQNAFDSSLKFRKPRLPPRIIAANAAKNPDFRVPKAPAKRKRIKLADRQSMTIDLDEDFEDKIIYMEVAKSRRKKDAADPERFLITDNEFDLIKSDQPNDDISSTLEFCLRKMRYCCVGYDNEQESTEVDGGDNVETQPNDPVSDTESDNLPLASFIGNLPDEDAEMPDCFADEEPSDEVLGGDLPQPMVPEDGQLGDQSLLRVKQVEKIKMNYDRKARRVNVRTVKKEMWNIIEEARDASLSEEKENMENEAIDELVQATSFQELRTHLDDKLEGDNKNNLTPAMALVCVLYLANEKDLELVQENNDSDFIIRAPGAK